MQKRLILVTALLLGAILTITACGKEAPKEPKELQKITFVLDWVPNTNHTGVYVAQEKGFFKDEGLDVTIIQPSDVGSDTLVATEKAQFGVSYQESVTFARSEKVPVVSIAAIIQHNTSGFASLKDKNITVPKDFEGKKYGGWGSPTEEATIKYLMTQAGADPSKVNILTTGTADFFQASSSDQIDFAWIFEGWDGMAAKLKGIDINYIDLGKLDPVFDYYTPVIITSENLIKTDKDLVERFMRAASKGYDFAIQKPEEAADIFIKAVPESDKALVKESQKYLAGQYKADAEAWGMQKEEVWQRYTDWLFSNGFIKESIDVKSAYTNDFIKK